MRHVSWCFYWLKTLHRVQIKTSVIFKCAPGFTCHKRWYHPFNSILHANTPLSFHWCLAANEYLATLVFANIWFNGKTMLKAIKLENTNPLAITSSPFINSAGAFHKQNVASQESRKADSVKSKQRWEDRADQRGRGKRKEKTITWYLLVASPFCLVTFLTVMAACRFWYSEISKPKQTSQKDWCQILTVMRSYLKYTNTWKPPSTLYTF